MKLVIPGKTFLVGEYAVLVGGKAIGVSTEPCFQADFNQKYKMIVHEKSAAGLLMKALGQTDLEIETLVRDYNVGGFGQSTAEFILTWFKYYETHNIETLTFLKDIFKEYRNVFNINPELKKIKPSGADLIFQLMGKMTYFNPDVIHSKSLNWVFPNLGFDIISTGIKVPTHEHLTSLDLKPLEPLCLLSENILSSYLSVDQDQFMILMKDWSLKLAQLGLQHSHSIDLKMFIEKCPDVILAKPNGALGADTITVFYKNENKNKIRQYFKEKNLSYITGLDQLSIGAHYVD